MELHISPRVSLSKIFPATKNFFQITKKCDSNSFKINKFGVRCGSDPFKECCRFWNTIYGISTSINKGDESYVYYFSECSDDSIEADRDDMSAFYSQSYSSLSIHIRLLYKAQTSTIFFFFFVSSSSKNNLFSLSYLENNKIVFDDN